MWADIWVLSVVQAVDNNQLLLLLLFSFPTSTFIIRYVENEISQAADALNIFIGSNLSYKLAAQSIPHRKMEPHGKNK